MGFRKNGFPIFQASLCSDYKIKYLGTFPDHISARIFIDFAREVFPSFQNSKEARYKNSKRNKGRKISEETKKKISVSKKGIALSKEHRNNISKAKKKDKIKRVCKFCKEEFEAYPSVEQNNRGLYCSTEHRYSDLRGENHPNWNNGSSFEPYCELFNNNFKERVREFWGRKCGISGITEEENGRKLCVHHVNYDKETCCNKNVPLFIPLSGTYHAKTNFNRDCWEEMLTNYIMIWFNGKTFSPKPLNSKT